MKTISEDRVFSGIQPSAAQVHIGNYLGAMKQFVTLAKQYPTIVCIVDLHALTSVEKPEELRSNSKSLAVSYLAIGLDPKDTIIFRQSDVPQVCELAWYLACQFPLGLLERAHKLKDMRAKSVSTNAGLMFYPILMAADILLYKATKVPVGADQKQHLEMSRDIAARFNTWVARNIFPIPEPLIKEDTGVIPGLDGRKMSKSYDNYIGLFETPKELRAKISRIVTDSKGLADKKDPTTCNVFQLHKLFATPTESSELAERYLSGGYGYGQAKEEVLKVVSRELDPLRERYEFWIKRESEVEDVLVEGAKKAREIAFKTMAEVRDCVGVSPFFV